MRLLINSTSTISFACVNCDNTFAISKNINVTDTERFIECMNCHSFYIVTLPKVEIAMRDRK